MASRHSLGTAFATDRAVALAGPRDLTGTEIIEGLTRLAAVLSLLASYKIGRGSGRTRARQRHARAAVLSPRNAHAASGRGSSSGPGRVDRTQRYRDWIGVAVAALWLALLLSIVGYVEFTGATVLADLEASGFAAMPQ